jgi:hypothetical protein
MAMPGLDTNASKHVHEPAKRARLERRVGPVLATVALAIVQVDRTIRRPIARRLTPLERLFRIRQSWHLYTNGPKHVRRLELWADDTLLYRTRDPEHAWRAATLENRKIRPMAETVAQKDQAFNWKGYGRFVVRSVLEDRPDTEMVRIITTQARFGQPEVRHIHGRAAHAPQWALRELAKSELAQSEQAHRERLGGSE